MPVMDGISTADIIRQRQNQGIYSLDMKILMLSGSSKDQIEKSSFERSCFSHLFDMILTKPIEIDRLSSILIELGFVN